MNEIKLLTENSIWCHHPKYPGYRFSPEGNAYRIDGLRLVQNRTHGQKRYTQWRLRDKDKWVYVNAHRVICEIFHLNIKRRPQVNHINGVKTDNRSDNLEWATASEQRVHALNVLKVPVARGSKNGMAILTESDVLDIRIRLDQNEMHKDIAKDYGVSRVCITNIASRKRWSHLV